MKKFLLATVVTGSLIAVPAVAETKADPFVSTQGSLGGWGAAAALLGGAALLALLVSSSDGT